MFFYSQVTWRKEGDMTPLTIGFFTFSPDTRIQLDHSLRTREWSLIIQAVKPEDEGWYHCQVTTKQEEMFYSIKLNVLSEYSLSLSLSVLVCVCVCVCVRMDVCVY